MNLFQFGDFTLNSGAKSSWKIECDALTDEDIAGLAEMISLAVGGFSDVIGVPRGGLKLAKALQKYKKSYYPTLIVDDVLTTGGSMERMKKSLGNFVFIGAVIFARGKCPAWITPLFQMPDCIRYEHGSCCC